MFFSFRFKIIQVESTIAVHFDSDDLETCHDCRLRNTSFKTDNILNDNLQQDWYHAHSKELNKCHVAIHHETRDMLV